MARKPRSGPSATAPAPLPVAVDASVPVPETVLSPTPASQRVTVLLTPVESVDTPSFFENLWRRAQKLVRPAPLVAPTALESVAERLDAFRLPGAPVASVAAVDSGRPVRFDAAGRRILVNLRHASVRTLLTQEASLHLALAALSEVNRELGSVSEADERELLRAALTQLATQQPR